MCEGNEIVCAIQNFVSNFTDLFGNFIGKLSSFVSTFNEVSSYILSILKALWYGVSSMLSGIRELIKEVFDGGVFVNVSTQLYDILYYYLGGPAVVFISSMLLIIVFRIGLAFVLKFFRLNIDYKRDKATFDSYNTPKASFKDLFHD